MMGSGVVSLVIDGVNGMWVFSDGRGLEVGGV